MSKQFLDLARGPLEEAVCYNGYIVNGFRFRKNEVNCNRRTQSCGVLVKGDANTGNRDYYSVLIDINTTWEAIRLQCLNVNGGMLTIVVEEL